MPNRDFFETPADESGASVFQHMEPATGSYLEDSYGCARAAKPSRREKRNGGLLVLSPTPLLERAEKFDSVVAKKGRTTFFGTPLFTMEKALGVSDQLAD